MRVYTHIDAVLGPKRSFTPEGFLYCEDVPLARTGEQIYMPSELAGIPPGADGLIHVERRAADVFADKAIASFVGKPFTDDHPSDNLTPSTWRDHARGTILNPRQGVGDQADLMVGDLLIYDKDAIQAIMDGKREVSCGYTAEYEIIGPERARQFDIIGNHVAAVGAGRCGGRCAIGDQEMTTTVATTRIGKVTLKDKIAKALDEALGGDDVEGGKTEHHVHVNLDGAASTELTEEQKKALLEGEETQDGAMLKLMKKMSDSISDISKRLKKVESKDADGDAWQDEMTVAEKRAYDEMTEEEKKAFKEKMSDKKMKDNKTKDETAEEKEEREKKEKEAKDRKAPVLDAAAIPGAIQELKERSELLVPGIRLPALDATAKPQVVTDTICMQRRSVLTTGMMLPKSAEIIQPFLTGQPEIGRMTCDAISAVFVGASEAMRARNNGASGAGGGGGVLPPGARKVGDAIFTGPVTPAELNARNAEFNRTVRKGVS